MRRGPIAFRFTWRTRLEDRVGPDRSNCVFVGPRNAQGAYVLAKGVLMKRPARAGLVSDVTQRHPREPVV